MDLTVVDFPVPLSPMIMTPPILGSITFSKRHSFISSCPTIAANGYTGLWLSLAAAFWAYTSRKYSNSYNLAKHILFNIMLSRGIILSLPQSLRNDALFSGHRH
jgi:hypothetical protein